VSPGAPAWHAVCSPDATGVGTVAWLTRGEGWYLAGEADFTPHEWVTLRRAAISAGVLVARSEGGGDDMMTEIFAVQQHLHAARRSSSHQLVRELASTRQFGTGMRPGMTRADYEEEALEAIRAAVDIVARRAPADLGAFRAFVVQLAEVAANAHEEGGFAGVGGVRVTPAEASAIARVRRACGLA
jgi:hypothetical protein